MPTLARPLVTFVMMATVSSREAAAQESRRTPEQRGMTVMGFDQTKTTHHFYLFEDGGAIEVSVNDAADATNRQAIRVHLSHIAMLFGQGNFQAPMLVHETKNVPGTAGMTRLKEKIRYT